MKPGTPIDTGNEDNAKKQMAAMAASVAGKDPQKAAENAGDMTAEKVADTLSNVTAALAKQDPKATRQVVDYLIKNKHLKFEGRRVSTLFDLKNVTNVMTEAYSHQQVLEKWERLSGLSVLDEAGKGKKRSGKGKDGLSPKSASGASSSTAAAAPSSSTPSSSPASAPETTKDESPPATQKSPASGQNPAGSEKGKPGDDKKAGEVPKEAGKFASLIDKVVGKIKNVKKSQIAAILMALDGKPNIAVS
jgi:hypothetical protein